MSRYIFFYDYLVLLVSVCTLSGLEHCTCSGMKQNILLLLLYNIYFYCITTVMEFPIVMTNYIYTLLFHIFVMSNLF